MCSQQNKAGVLGGATPLTSGKLQHGVGSHFPMLANTLKAKIFNTLNTTNS